MAFSLSILFVLLKVKRGKFAFVIKSERTADEVTEQAERQVEAQQTKHKKNEY